MNCLRTTSLLILFVATHTLAQPAFVEDYPDTLNKKRLHFVTGTGISAYAAGLSFLGFIWYRDHERQPFHYYNDSEGYLQMDKAGHAYGAYWESRAAYHALRWAGMSHKKALIYGGPVGLVFQTPIEVFDGLYEGWGFSWSDVAANAFGSLLFTTQQAFLKEQLVSMKFSYAPSGYPKYHTILGENELESFFLDYNAHTYWLSGNIGGLTGLQKVPKWLNIAIGHSANGMIREFENPEYYQGKPFPELERYRQWLLSLDVDFSRIPTKKKWLRSLFRTVNLLKVPFPAIELNRINHLTFKSLYF